MATRTADAQSGGPALNAPARFTLTKSVGFEAAHHLPASQADPGYRAVHGHSFRLEAEVSGPAPTEGGWVEDFGTITRALERVAAELDHAMLNEVTGLSEPTLENLCLWCAERLQAELPGLSAVTLARPSLHERCTLHLG